MKYVLASASPRRKELLTQAGFDFDVMPADIEEIMAGNNPPEIVMNLARQKALHVFKTLPAKPCTVIGADTVVVYNGEILGKPSGALEAYDMLSLLADRTHQVYTGVCLVTGSTKTPDVRTFYEKTDVTFYPVSRQDLQSYIATGDPLDKAGAYGIQGPFAIHVKCISGDYNNVVGLPIARLYHELDRSMSHEH
ncbi:septum formation protein Maf [Clostridium sp. AF15-17LB]|nr:septum formation protein Maf [Clostridium sp. AF15-17LB]